MERRVPVQDGRALIINDEFHDAGSATWFV
jgi:hypothetical protein